ncbi:MAG: DUF1844 domain-containing protein [Candidatus Omnitrophica bacterium]|nr:DUF1844 domain-containing protein [Candidatus Omnitrophota bacterium]
MEDKKEKKEEEKIEETKDKEEKGEQKSQQEMPPLEINFALFISSMGMQALMHLGEITNPVTNKKEQDLKQAKQSINILEILEKKTKGNLDKNEEQILKNLLYEVRMKYVEKVKGDRGKVKGESKKEGI